ncbi:MAG TPA: ABC transporter substrate-binding protein [Acidimicrobiales bacterium]|nr:ABC transporter substrate-binding protein [Acidimicrobiales bacterium]
MRNFVWSKGRWKRNLALPWIASAVVVAGSAIGIGVNTASAATAPSGASINIGLITILTGPAAFIGDTFLTGATTALTIINQDGGVLGRPLKLIPVDDGGDPVDAVTQARQMLAVDNVSGVLGLAAPDYPDALPILNSAKMVSFTHIGNPSLDTQMMPYSFRSQPSDAVVGTAMAYYASLKKYKKVAIALDATEGSQTLRQPMLSALHLLGIKVLTSVTLPVSAGSYVAEIQKLMSSHPQAILLQTSQTDQAGTFGTEIQQQGGGHIPVIGSDLTSSADWVKAVGNAYDQREVTSITPSASGGGGQGPFLKEYNLLYHKGPENVAPNMYDSTNVIALAMDAAHSIDPKKYVKFITKVTTPGPGVTTVYTYQEGLKLLKAGKQIKYFGVGSPMTFTKYHTVAGSFSAVKTSLTGATTVLNRLSAEKLSALLPGS